MKKNFDYKRLYLENYKNLPNLCFVLTWSVLALASIVVGIFFIADYEEILGICILFGGNVVAYVIALIERSYLAVALSQKIVVADALLDMSDDKSTSSAIVDEELPEL